MAFSLGQFHRVASTEPAFRLPGHTHSPRAASLHRRQRPPGAAAWLSWSARPASTHECSQTNPISFLRRAGQFILWKISLQQLDGLTWKGKASFVFKASYGGRDMFSDAVSCDYKPGRPRRRVAEFRRSKKQHPPLPTAAVALQAKYVFKDSKGSDAVGVELFNGTPGDAASLVGKLDIDLREFRKANASSDAWMRVRPRSDVVFGRSRHRRPPRSPVAGTAAKVKLGITCTVCAVRGRVPPTIPRRRFRAAALKTKALSPRRRTTTTSRRAAWTPRARRARASSAYASSGRGGAACEPSAGFSAGRRKTRHL